MKRKFLVLDYETRSKVDLKKLGGYEYANHKSTKILCAAWACGTRDTLQNSRVLSWSPAIPETKSNLSKLVTHLNDPQTIVVAHNAFFEKCITDFVLTRYAKVNPLPSERMVCTASLAAALALPRDLAGAGSVLGLPVQKDKEGHRVMLKMCKPRKPTKNNPAEWHNSKSDLMKVIDYCIDDIRTEVLLFLKLPMLTKVERLVWLLDQKINFRGVPVDRDLITIALQMVSVEMEALQAEVNMLTNGQLYSAGQVKAAIDWLETEGVTLRNLQSKTVDKAIESGIATGKAKRFLEIRQAVSKSSTKKYEAMELRSRTDGRVRDTLMYHGASTGRWSGRGIQVQNLPRGTIKDTDTAANDILEGDIDLLRILYGDPMQVFSSCIRSAIVPTKGKALFSADYSAIECRVLFWLADHFEGVEAFRAGVDQYVHMALDIFSLRLLDDCEPDQRFVGKQAVLGCGYQMGPDRFMEQCASFGQPVSKTLAKAAVDAYRAKHWPVPKFWALIEKVAMAAIRNPGKVYTFKRMMWYVKGRFLCCKLPSGRLLRYCDPKIKMVIPKWGGEVKIPKIVYMGVDSTTKKWTQQGTYGGKLCIAGGTLVLTDFGWVPIEQVTAEHLVWDGVQWVNTDGNICNGVREVINAYGAYMTSDHLVLTDRGWKIASQSQRYNRAYCRPPYSSEIPWQQREKITVGGKVCLQKGNNYSSYRIDQNGEKENSGIMWLQEKRNHIKKENHPWHVGTPSLCSVEKYVGQVQATNTPSLAQLWRQRDNCLQKVAKVISEFLGRYGYKLQAWFNFRQGEQQCGLQQSQLQMGNLQSASKQQKNKRRVYDLVNCGPRSRFTILADGRPLIVHNCENVVQAIARDLMAAAMLRAEEKGYQILMTVHDELVAERPKGEGSVDEFCELMARVPKWADGCPIAVEGWVGERYKK